MIEISFWLLITILFVVFFHRQADDVYYADFIGNYSCCTFGFSRYLKMIYQQIFSIYIWHILFIY